ncbi:MAG: glycosyltransferase family 4 protein [Thermodesulfobacteriota bacterium]
MVVEYANYLADRGHHVSLWYNINNTVFEINPLVKLRKIPLPTKLGTIIHSLVKKFHSDAIVVDIIPLASLLSIRNRSRLIYFAQGFDESYHTNRIQKSLIRILYFFSLNLMKVKGIAVSNQLAHMLREKYNARITVVENGIDLLNFYHDPDEELIGSKANRKAVLLLSRRDHAKGLDIAMNVINKISEEWKDRIEIWICGDDLDEQILKVNVRNFGWVVQDRLRKLLSSADVLFYPTRHEGFGLLPLEAMACGCPVITTEAVRYLADAENALIAKLGNEFNIKEKLERILTDRQLTDDLRNNGFITVKKYDLRHSTINFEEAIKEIIS